MQAMRRHSPWRVAALLVFLTTAHAQFGTKESSDHFRHTTILSPPLGVDVAILVWEDMACPSCAHWFPYENAAANKYHIPLIRRDFPLPQHVWSFQAAVNARYLQDHVSPQLADGYRGDIFKSQMRISDQDDLQQYTKHWFEVHRLSEPLLFDHDGKLASEVQADIALGYKLNIERTPTVVVVTREKYQLMGGSLAATDLDKVVQTALESIRKPH